VCAVIVKKCQQSQTSNAQPIIIGQANPLYVPILSITELQDNRFTRSLGFSTGWHHVRSVVYEVALMQVILRVSSTNQHSTTVPCTSILAHLRCAVAVVQQRIITFTVFNLKASSLTSHLVTYRVMKVENQ
jgi:hypothetical protein